MSKRKRGGGGTAACTAHRALKCRFHGTRGLGGKGAKRRPWEDSHHILGMPESCFPEAPPTAAGSPGSPAPQRAWPSRAPPRSPASSRKATATPTPRFHWLRAKPRPTAARPPGEARLSSARSTRQTLLSAASKPRPPEATPSPDKLVPCEATPLPRDHAPALWLRLQLRPQPRAVHGERRCDVGPAAAALHRGSAPGSAGR